MTLTNDQIARIQRIIHRLETSSGPAMGGIDQETVNELCKIFPVACNFNGALRNKLTDSVVATLLRSLLCSADGGGNPPGPGENAAGFIYNTSPTSIAALRPDKITLPDLTTITGTFQPLGASNLSAIELPLLETVGINFVVVDTSLLTTLTLPSLVTISNSLVISFNSGLVSLSLPSLVTVGGDVDATDNAALENFSAPNWMPGDIGISFIGCALTAESVNHILARCVASSTSAASIALQGGTNAAPTGQGILDKATIIGNGSSVTTN